MTRKQELAELESNLSNLHAKAQEMGLNMCAYLLAMAQIEISEQEEKYSQNLKRRA